MPNDLHTLIWYSYQCLNPDCPEREAGVVFDIRLSDQKPLPTLRCPICNALCDCDGTVEADEWGHRR